MISKLNMTYILIVIVVKINCVFLNCVLLNRSIPKIKINGNFSSPWFDSECYEAYRSKERAHIKFKSVPSLSNELKRDATRKNFNNVCSAKMRENLYNRDDPVLRKLKF